MVVRRNRCALVLRAVLDRFHCRTKPSGGPEAPRGGNAERQPTQISKAAEFLDWWILNNVAVAPADAGEKEIWAHKLAETFAKAAAQLGIDDKDRVMDR